ncbi:transmembrane efflux protein [Streptomyces albus]|uniref:Transmembrane efflux protein n=1 Tax=Streptomyces albus (strain ATCC 21838 / DSM 41398 / FERM P-419 / JCM 4703 / NBRC 107858) TaxID=1081613 RepID=A0A0B5F5R5_STRA4|nr:transmembrane efflux protein [Streptomyces albus]AOU80009.1 transmembrane efflux protein [Streptomyces albus]AYN35727.1 MFS transporter [Streptomyces albus]
MSSRRTTWPLIALFASGYLASYLLPSIVSRLIDGLGLAPTQAGLIGSALLLSSASAGFALASRIERLGPARLARAGLLLCAGGYGAAALSQGLPLVIAGSMAGGLGSGTAITVAASRIAGLGDPHRASTTGLLCVSALAGGVFLTIPYLGGGHGLPFGALAVCALLTLPVTGRLGGPAPAADSAPAAAGPLPYRRSGMVLAGAMLCWSMAQNSLWGVSGRIGLDQAGMSEVAVGAVFAAALGAGLLGVLGAGALGTRLGRALPMGAGTALIGCCIVVTACSTTPAAFASGQITWNVLYPAVLSYLIGVAASLDTRGRWAVLAGSASALGTAFGPVVGSGLSALAGYRAMGLLLCAGLFVLAAPMTAVTLHTAGRPLLPGALRRRATRASYTATATAAVPAGLAERDMVEIPTPATWHEPGLGALDPAGDESGTGEAVPAGR